MVSTTGARGLSAQEGAVDLSALSAVAPVELGVLRERRARRRHLGAAFVDLAARGHLVVQDAGNDPDLGEALDWVLVLCEGEAGGAGEQVGLRSHEQRLLGLVAATPSRLLSRVRSCDGVAAVLDAARADVVERGWLAGGRLPRRTALGRAALADLQVARASLVRQRPAPQDTAALLPLAVSLGLGDLWAARLGQQRPPAPAWFHSGTTATARGWLGVTAFLEAAAAAPPPGGGAGSAYPGTAGYPGPW